MAKKVEKKNLNNSINFDEGYKEFCINNDESRIIKFNPADISIIERAQTAMNDFQEELKEIDEDDDSDAMIEIIKKANKLAKDKIDYIFGYPVADVAFGKQSPLSSKDGVTLFERFIEGALVVIKKEVELESKKRSARIDKYMKVIK